MLEVIENASEIKRNRPRISGRSYETPLLKTRIFQDTNLNPDFSDSCVKEYIKERIVEYSEPNILYAIRDQRFKSCLLTEANLQLNKALYNWSIYKQLVSRGLWTWAYVTLYYSQFYSINGLLNLQGNAFSRPTLSKADGELKQCLFHVYPKAYVDGSFYFEMRSYKPHESLWRQYYDVYNDFRFKLNYYSDLYEFDKLNEFRFMELRHYINYDISFLANDFIEYWLPLEDLESFAAKMQRDSLVRPIEEDEYSELEYIASLRIQLLFEILHEVLDNANSARRCIYNARIEMLSKIQDNTCVSQYLTLWSGTQ